MSYLDQLYPWCIIHFLPNMNRRIISRFRRRNDAEAHLRILLHHAPTRHYAIVFDPATAPTPLPVVQ